MKLFSNAIYVEVDDELGYTTRISQNENDMNWIIEKDHWGFPDNFNVKDIKKENNKIIVLLLNQFDIQLKIEKYIDNNGYNERYELKNISNKNFDVNNDSFGLPFPYNCNFTPKANFLQNTCLNHIWCGGNCSWIYSVRANGKKPYLIMNTEAGSFDDYSFKYDITNFRNGSYYRGIPYLHLTKQQLKPNDTIVLLLGYHFGVNRPDDFLQDYENAMRVYANKYTTCIDEDVLITLESKKTLHNVEFYANNISLPCQIKDNIAICKCSFNELGEKKIIVKANDNQLKMFINVQPSLKELYNNRVKFIIERQQMHSSDALNGAYLSYDNETNEMKCVNGDNDHNACRERIGMGVLVASALSENFDKATMNSLITHREFIEREILELSTMYVCDNIGYSKDLFRSYNFPWVSTYYLNWYNLTKEKKYIEISAKILIEFWSITNIKTLAQCIEFYDIAIALKKENLIELYNTFISYVEKYCDFCNEFLGITDFSLYGVECSWCNECPCNLLSYLSQGYKLLKKEIYLTTATKVYDSVKGFFAHQPDYHLYAISIRWWDNFWFGKYPSFGDVFPHYWSTLSAWALDKYDDITKSNDARDIKENLLGNLCLYSKEGRANNNYLYPYRIELYSSNPNYHNVNLPPQKEYGKRYDPLANDQDWAMYYAGIMLNK